METVDHPELLARERQIAEHEAGRRRPKRHAPAPAVADASQEPRDPATAASLATNRGRQTTGQHISTNADRIAVTGRSLWTELHRRPASYTGDAAAERAWLVRFAARVPCGTCREEWDRIVREMPPDLTNATTYSLWTWEAHNRVNRKLGKPEIGEDEARRIWEATS